MGLEKVKKRDDRVVRFEKEKVTNAIMKAVQAVGGKNEKSAEKLAMQVVTLLKRKYKDQIPSVEDVQDMVEKVLIENGHAKTAKAYILYREQRAAVRDVKKLLSDTEIVDDYLKENDWQVRENSNMSYSLQGLNSHLSSKVIANYWMHKLYPREIQEAHRTGDFHIHDLGVLGAYCVGWDLRDVLISGFRGVRGKVECKPPKHFRVALGQIVNFFYTLQGEAAGAQAFSNFDTYLAPFIRADNLDYKRVKQALQEFVFNINVPTRVGFQSLVYDETVVYKHNGKIKFGKIGEIADEQFDKNIHRILEDNPGSFAIENYDDYKVLSFDSKGNSLWKSVKAFVRHKVPKKSEFVKIKTSRGSASVSKAHSMFSFEKLDGAFCPAPTSSLQIKPTHSNGKKTENNHIISVKKVKNEGKINSLDIVDLIEETPSSFRNKIRVIISKSDIEKIKSRIKSAYTGLTEFYLEYGISSGKTYFRDCLDDKTISYEIWKRFGNDSKDVIFKLKNSEVEVPRIINKEKISDFVKLAAWYITEGHNDSSTGMFISQSKKNVSRIIDILDALGVMHTAEESYGFSAKEQKTKTKILKIRCNGLLSWLISFTCGSYSTKKTVPSYIFNLHPDIQKTFMDELILGDGYKTKNYYELTNTSKTLSLSLSLLYSMNNIRYSVYEVKYDKKEWNDQYTIRVYKTKPKNEYSVGDFEARTVNKIDKFRYEREYEYDISIDSKLENFAGGSGLLMFHNTPFTNVTLDLLVPNNIKNDAVIIGGKMTETTYGEYQEEMNTFNKAFAEVMMEGDAAGRVFTFPIPTYNITKDFDWDDPKFNGIWEMTAKYGIPYFSNFINSDMSPDDARSMCCRLRLDNRELRKRGGGLFGANPLTGSIGVVTINMPRLGFLSKNEREFFARLDNLMDLAKKSLEIKRKIIETFTDNGLYPYSKFYLRSTKDGVGAYWKNHFSTIGLVGLNEAVMNFMDANIADDEARVFAVKVLDHMRDRISGYQEETGNIYNLEATPGEGASHGLARLDKKLYPDIVVANEYNVRKFKAAPYYTNSSQLPVNYTDDIFTALDLQEELQTKYTGGTVLHGFVGERMPSPEATKNLVRKIAENYKIPYFTITPTFSICPKHGYLAGEHKYCPKCDEEIGYAKKPCTTCEPVKVEVAVK